MTKFFEPIYVTKPGAPWKQVESYSHYNDPVDPKRALHGNSRLHGDAAPETQEEVIKILVEKAREHGLNIHETALVIQIARVESGFNPDAAAGSTSALGVGQFVDKTGLHYHLDASNRFDAEEQCRALVLHTKDNLALAKKRAASAREVDELTYKFHHDGPTEEHGGLELAQKKVAPYVDGIEKLVLDYLCRGFRLPIDPTGTLALAKGGRAYQHPDELRVTSRLVEKSYEHNEKKHKGGYFPIGANTTWHGGVHLHCPTNPSMPVVACAAGEVIACRLEKATDDEQHYWGSRNFVLLRHTLDEATVAQCRPLQVPFDYTVLKSGVKFDAAGAPPPLAPGDVLERTDDERKRKVTDTACRAKIKSLNEDVSIIEGYDLTRAAKLYRDKAKKELLLDLVKGDRLELVTQVDLHRGDAEPSTGTAVRLAKLAPGLVDPRVWKVTAPDFHGLRADMTEASNPDGDKRDQNRVLDLKKGDILEKVDPDKPGIVDKGRVWHEVIVKVGADKSIVVGYEITQTTALRSGPSAEANEKVGWLRKMDVVDLVQARSAGAYDLVRPTKLAGQVTISFRVAAAKYDVKDKVDGKTIETVHKDAILSVTGPSTTSKKVEWFPVRTPSGTAGFVKPSGGLSPKLGARQDAPGWKDLVGKTFFVDVGKYGKANEKTRLAQEAQGWIAEGRDLEPTDGNERVAKYADRLSSGASASDADKVFYFDVTKADAKCFGKTRRARFASFVGTEGDLSVEADKLRARNSIPTEIERALVGSEWFSLYMHLKDREELTDERLATYRWLPQVPKEYRLKRNGALFKDADRKEPLFDLVSGDVLDAVGSAETPVRHAKVKELASRQVLHEIEVKKAAILWADRKHTKPLVALVPGDVLAPGVGYGKGDTRAVLLKKLAPGECDAEYTVDVDGKSVFSQPNSSDQTPKTKTKRGDKLRVVAPVELGGPVWNYVSSGGKTGWVSRKKPEHLPATKAARDTVYAGWQKATGHIQWAKDSFEEKMVDRKDLLPTGTEGWLELPRETEVVTQVDPRVAPILATGVVYDLAARDAAGQPTRPYPKVEAGAPLWVTGKFGALDESDDLHKRKPLLHWEIFSRENLLRFHEEWTGVEDTTDDYNIDNRVIMDAITRALDAEGPGKAKEVLGSDGLMDEDEVIAFYQGKSGEAMRRFACYFAGEWGIDVESALGALRGVGVSRWFKQVIGRAKNQITPQLFWQEALQRGVPLPQTSRTYHYNPIAFVEEFSRGRLADEKLHLPVIKKCDIHGLEDIADWMRAEMVQNANSSDMLEIRAHFKHWDWSEWNTKAGDILASYYHWYNLVRTGGPWDHKKFIREKFGTHICDFPTKALYQYDIWSNIHYGYVGLAAGFPKYDLLAGGGLAQIAGGLSNVPDGYWKRLWKRMEPLPEYAAAFDDPKDQVAIKIGFLLWEEYGASCTTDQMVEIVRAFGPDLATQECESKCDAPKRGGPVHQSEAKAVIAQAKSGKDWVKAFPGSKSLDDLVTPFRDNAKDFVAALEAAGCKVKLSATLRPAQRAYMMHWAYRIAHEKFSPDAVPARPDVPIQWDHDDDDASRAAAKEMVEAFRIAYAPALDSHHIKGIAVDMSISWTKEPLQVKRRDGTIAEIYGPMNGAENTDLHQVGATYDVHKLVGDAPHWSVDGG